MKFLKIIIPVVVCSLWCSILNHSLNINTLMLPPLGKFFSPFDGFWQNVKSNSYENLSHLTETSVEGSVFFDERAVPHITSSNLNDAYFIQGYVHAMHRLWQMDFSTRAAEGRISELIGTKAIEFDKNKRRKGLAEAARMSLEEWKKFPEIFKLLESYCNGVNFYIRSLNYKDYPIEYKLMDFKPELWTPFKSSLFHKAMAETLCGKDQDVELTNAKILFGDDFKLLYPELDSMTDPVIPSETKWGFKIDSNWRQNKETIPAELIYIPEDSIPSGLGSNNWAVGRNKSETGNPILCNDPHLQLSLPSIWYEQQIITPDVNVYGVSFAGIPGVIIGFNKDIAWGITNAAWDVLDWYKIQWVDSSKKSYVLDGQTKNLEYRIEKIPVRNHDTIMDTVKLTTWGPIVYDDSKNMKYDLAMHWIIQDRFPVIELSTFVELNKASNYSEYRNAIKNFSYPAQNIAYADRSGSIALTVQGEMPLKSNQQGRFTMDGSLSHNGWHGFLSNHLNPQTLNPERGFISSANQRSTTEDFPVYYSNGDFREFRGTMINRLLSREEKWNVEEMKKLQNNNYSLLAESLLPVFLHQMDTQNLDQQKKYLIHNLNNWNYEYDSLSEQAVVFDLWMNKFYTLMWDEITKDSLKKYVSIPSEQATIHLVKNYAELKYYDIQSTSEVEDLRSLVRISFDSATIELQRTNVKSWGRYKSTHIDHLARIPSFGIPYISTSGSKDIINACWKTWGPSWRMIVELTNDGPKAIGVYPGGQDGRPGNSHYMDMVETWRKGDYYELKYCQTTDELKAIKKSELQFSK